MSNTHSPQAGNPKKSEQHQGMMHGDTATSQSEFHTYGMLKTVDAIEFYFDGQMTHRVKMSDIKGPNPFVDPDNNYILKLNQMVGGNYLARPKDGRAGDWSDKTYVDATKFADDYKGGADGVDFAGSTMYVDYVRVYEPTPAPSPEQPSQPVDPTPVPTPETPAQPENPAKPEQPAQPVPAPENPVTPVPEQPAPSPTPAPAPEPTQPAQPAPAKPSPAKPQPAQPQPSPAPAVPSQPADQAQPSPEQSAQPDQPQKPKPQKPRPDRLANTGMTSWYRPVVVMWRSFCGWITSWWFW